MKLMLLSKPNDRGYAMLGVLFLLILGGIISTGLIMSSGTAIKTRALVKVRTERFYEVEETMNKVVNWLQANSKNIVTAFDSKHFSDNFTIGDPAEGSNEGQQFKIPSMVKMRGTTNSVMLSNNSFFGTSAFPITTNVDSAASFDAANSFKNADLGKANARIVLMWARSSNGNYEPIFRIDAVTGNNPDRGVHTYTYVHSTLVTSGGGKGFFGANHINLGTPNNDCYSLKYTNTGNGWNSGAQQSNCQISSNGIINIKSKVYGTASSKQDPGVILNNGGNVSGAICQSASCTTSALPAVNSWATYCPGNTNDIMAGNLTTLSTAGCFRDITIPNGNVVNFTDYNNPYYLRTLNFKGAQGNITFGTIPSGKKITLYMEVPDLNYTLNGNRLINTNNAPHQVEIIYTGVTPLRLNGTSAISANIIAPNASVEVQGNFNYFGGIQALALDVTGNARLFYDEGLGANPTVSDLHYALKKTGQRYR